MLATKLVRTVQVAKRVLTLLEQTKYTRVFAGIMFVGSLAHTRVPQMVI